MATHPEVGMKTMMDDVNTTIDVAFSNSVAFVTDQVARKSSTTWPVASHVAFQI